MLVGEGFLRTTSKQFSKEIKTKDSWDHTDDIWNRGSNKGKGKASTLYLWKASVPDAK